MVEETVVLRAIGSPASVKEVYATRICPELLKWCHIVVLSVKLFLAPPNFF